MLFRTAAETLLKKLANGGGEVSSSAFRKELQDNELVRQAQDTEDPKAFAKDLVLLLKAYEPKDFPEYEKPPAEWRYLGRSFLSVERFNSRIQATESAIISENRETAVSAENEVPATPEERRQNKQEEARLGGYVSGALEEIYATDSVPENAAFCFDVHSNRGGGDYENIDELAVHWRTYQSPMPGEVEAFQERYRKQLEDGHVLERKNRPRLRAL